MKNFLYALPSIALVSVANVIMKWRFDSLGRSGFTLSSQNFLVIFLDPYILMGFLSTAISIIWWLCIISRVQVSITYPIIQSGVIVATVILSNLFLNEKLIPIQSLGIALVILGVILVSSSN